MKVSWARSRTCSVSEKKRWQMRSTRERWRVASSAKAAGSSPSAPATRSWSDGSATLRANRLNARTPRIPDRKYDESGPWLHEKMPGLRPIQPLPRRRRYLSRASWLSGRTGKAGTLEVLGGVEVSDHAGVVYVDVGYAGRVGGHDGAGSLVFGCGRQFTEELAREEHRMAAASLVARDRDAPAGAPIAVDNCRERIRP